ncbi:MAG: M48 family metalloprotease [Desulfovibrionales bacterium]
MNYERFYTHTLCIAVASSTLLLGMLLLTAGIGWFFGGTIGIAMSFGVFFACLVLGPTALDRKRITIRNGTAIPRHHALHLHLLVDELSRRAGLAGSPELVFVNSPQVNAFAVRHRKTPVLGLTEGLVRTLNFREIAAVMAHEISHFRTAQTRLMETAHVLHSVISSLSLVGAVLLLLAHQALDLTLAENSLALGLLLAGPVFSAIMLLGITRLCEYEADLNAVRLSRDPVGLASALHKIHSRQHGFWNSILSERIEKLRFLHTHPATERRIQRLLALSSSRTSAIPG